MAIYHLHVKNVPKGSGQNKAIYNMREGKYSKDEAEVLYKETGNLPKWTEGNHRTFWRAADNYERGGERYRGRAAKEVQIALPRELSDEAKIKLAREYTRSIVGDNHAYAMAIHKGEKATENPHVHLLFSERRDDGIERTEQQYFKRANSKQPELGGVKKSRDIHAREWVSQQRKSWEVAANNALEREGHSARIDCRTLKAQGINREPSRHVGVVSYNAIMEREDITDRAQDIYGAMLEAQDLREKNQELEAQRVEVRRELNSDRFIGGVARLYIVNEANEGGEKLDIDWQNFDKSLSREIEIAEQHIEETRALKEQERQQHSRSYDDGLSL